MTDDPKPITTIREVKRALIKILDYETWTADDEHLGDTEVADADAVRQILNRLEERPPISMTITTPPQPQIIMHPRHRNCPNCGMPQ